jgi:hypothetical protein
MVHRTYVFISQIQMNCKIILLALLRRLDKSTRETSRDLSYAFYSCTGGFKEYLRRALKELLVRFNILVYLLCS